MTISGIVTGKRAYVNKIPKDSQEMTMMQPKMLDCYVATFMGTLAGSLFGPFLLPMKAMSYVQSPMMSIGRYVIGVVSDKDVVFVPK